MSSATHPAFAASTISNRPHVPNSLPANNTPVVPVGAFAPGTKIQVGGHRVVIEKYLSEGGFAHVYLVRLPKPIDGEDGAVLKRVAVPDKEALASMRAEVDTMKKLKGRRHIVTYIDSHASQLKGGGYEVFLLMEYCAGGGLIDFMNTRLQNRLTEPEILQIFSDVAQGVACMHYLKPPLLHRDLKVENILISSSGSFRQYKLCDFGSTAPPRSAAKTAAEGRLIEDDVQKHTTLQYRSPEMIDVYRKQPIDEKSDIWALGVLLYKLCYYITPFEEQGQMAILNASFKFPGYPVFTDRTKKLIASMLQEKPQVRPNIYQVVREVCLMRGTEISLKDIYTGRPASEARRDQQLPSPPGTLVSPPIIGAYKATPVDQKTAVPEITPMRRGRPDNSTAGRPGARPSPSPMRIIGNDPFAALDSSTNTASDAALFDEAASRFPALDHFSILHESGTKFAFDQKTQSTAPFVKDVAQRVTEALADDAFALPTKSTTEPLTHLKSVPSVHSSSNPVISRPVLPVASRPQVAPQQMHQPKTTPQQPKMVSTGTMTSPSPPSPGNSIVSQPSRPIYRFPQPADQRSTNQPRGSNRQQLSDPPTERASLLAHRPALADHRSKSQTPSVSAVKSSTLPRTSLDGERPVAINYSEPLNPSRSINSKIRPVSAHIDSSHKVGFPRSRSRSRSRGSPRLDAQRHTSQTLEIQGSQSSGSSSDEVLEPTKIASNVDFLKAMEEEEPNKRKEKRSSSGSKHIKRASMPSISLSGTKSLLAGRFGEAFRRFETNTSGSAQRDPSPPPDLHDSQLTPIAGSEATDGRSDDGQGLEESMEAPPEVRRELERRRLSQEERRVAEGAAAYKQRVAEKGPESGRGRRDGSRAALIQNKVQALLVENGKSSPTKTADGYGRYTESPARLNQPIQSAHISASGNIPSHAELHITRHREIPTNTSSAPPVDRPFTRPSAPPKPQALRTGGHGDLIPSLLTKSLSSAGRPTNPYETTPTNNDKDWETDFSKRYPSLSGIEMVETTIAKDGGVITTKDV